MRKLLTGAGQQKMSMNDPATIGIIVSIIVAVISLIGTIIVAIFSVKNTQITAADEISSGATNLLAEYRKELDTVKLELGELKSWKLDMIDFFVPFVEGSKLNEQQLLDAGIEPFYRLPELPEWFRQNKKT